MERVVLLALAAGIAVYAQAAEVDTTPALNATTIVERNVAARGGQEAWHKIQTMVWIGHIETGSGPHLPYVLEMKRPNKTRFEIRANGQLSLRIFDGTEGWKLGPSANGRPAVRAYTPEELNYARDAQGFDGPLIDSRVQGIDVTLEGIEEIEGHKAYRLRLDLPDGAKRHVWIDAQSYLDIKYDRTSRNPVGMPGVVSVFNRDFRETGGLQIPFLVESGMGGGLAANKMVIDRIVLNPSLDDRVFSRPDVSPMRGLAGAAQSVQHPGGVDFPMTPGKGLNQGVASSDGHGQ